MITIHKFQSIVHTSEDWFPSIEGNKLILALHIPSPEFINAMLNPEKCYRYRVSVWGGDDMGMERDFFREEDLHSALNLYATVRKLKDVTVQRLKELSFVSA